MRDERQEQEQHAGAGIIVNSYWIFLLRMLDYRRSVKTEDSAPAVCSCS